jgi:hypothetical protein
MKHSIIAALVAVAAVQLLTLLWSSSAAAAEPRFKECIGTTVAVTTADSAATGKVVPPEKPTQLPAGWTVVGGGAKGTDGFVVLCR